MLIFAFFILLLPFATNISFIWKLLCFPLLLVSLDLIYIMYFVLEKWSRYDLPVSDHVGIYVPWSLQPTSLSMVLQITILLYLLC